MSSSRLSYGHINVKHFQQLHTFIKERHPDLVGKEIYYNTKCSKSDYSIIPFTMTEPRDIDVIVGSKITVAAKEKEGGHIPIAYKVEPSKIGGFSAIIIYYS